MPTLNEPGSIWGKHARSGKERITHTSACFITRIAKSEALVRWMVGTAFIMKVGNYVGTLFACAIVSESRQFSWLDVEEARWLNLSGNFCGIQVSGLRGLC